MQEQDQIQGRRGFSIAERTDLWARWKAGESMSDIGRALHKHPASIFAVLAVRGGIARAARRRAERALTSADREQISRGLAAEQSIREIARTLERAPSTIQPRSQSQRRAHALPGCGSGSAGVAPRRAAQAVSAGR